MITWFGTRYWISDIAFLNIFCPSNPNEKRVPAECPILSAGMTRGGHSGELPLFFGTQLLEARMAAFLWPFVK